MAILKNSFSKTATTIFLLFSIFGIGQSVPKEYSQKMWSAMWISVPNTNGKQYGVYLFRKQLQIDKVPQKYPVYISADNSYQLYVNGTLVSRGPAKGDPAHWFFDQLDLAVFLKPGKNTIAAKIWNGGKNRPESQMSFSTGFILQGVTSEIDKINTNESWKCIQDQSYSPVLISDFSEKKGMMLLPGYYVAGSGEKINMMKNPLGWEKESFDDTNWKSAQIVSPGIPHNAVGFDSGNSWRLLPSDLPQMQSNPQRFDKLRQSSGVTVASTFPQKKTELKIPANTTATLLLDQSFMTNAYPIIKFSGGSNAVLSLTYAESLYKDKNKGNRNEVEGKAIIGRKDSIICSGVRNQLFSPLTYRTYRYMEVKIKTASDPLVVDDISSIATGYPFDLKAHINTNDTVINKIFDISWRTARLCAMDTYMDCPYWEQLQYIGDTRIQAMISLYNSGDDRLIKNGINLIHYSSQAEGITASRYPSNNVQIITPFSLWYIGILDDYLMYGSDKEFVKSKISSTRLILDYCNEFQDSEGSVKNLPGWSFTDWVNQWERGTPPIGRDGSSALLDLQLLLAYQNAINLETEVGLPAIVSAYQVKVDQLSQTIKTKYWDNSKNLYADTSDKDKFSQHTNSLAILAGLAPKDQTIEFAKRILSDKYLAPASIYFKYYVHQALVKAGLGDDYMNWLDIWKKNIALGMTTWGEDSNVETTRSDCHAWGASPSIEFFRTILGIQSASANFKTVRIEPHLGSLKKIGGEIPHPNGVVKVSYDLNKNTAVIWLPANINGQFIWKSKITRLLQGENKINL